VIAVPARLSFSALSSVAILVWVVYLYMKGRLKEDHALLWFFVALSVLLLSVSQDLLFGLSDFLGAGNPTSLVYAAFIAFLFSVSVYFSMRLSQLSDRVKTLAQEIAILRASIEYHHDSANES
jgi:hypothetical protein